MYNKIKPGSKVKIIGPSVSNEASHLIGTTAVISKETMGENFQIVGDTYYCFPKSSLELIQDFDIGDEVEITGRSCAGYDKCIGYRFIVEEVSKSSALSNAYAAPGYSWYPKSSLKLVRKASEKPIVVGSEAYQETDIRERLAKVEKRQHDHDHKQLINVVRLELLQDHGTNESALQKGDWFQINDVALGWKIEIRYAEEVIPVSNDVIRIKFGGKMYWLSPSQIKKLSIQDIENKVNK